MEVVKQYLTKKEVAEMLSLSPKTIERLMRDQYNPLPYTKTGRFVRISMKKLNEWLNKQSNG
jgi:excisionase family DNA binding protein